MKRAREFAREFLSKHPEHKEEVIGLLELCQSEIEEGGSEEHEIELFEESCEQLLEEDED